MSKKTDSVAIVSGGLDSTTLVYEMLAQGLTPHLLSFNYGQRHSKELQFAALTARQAGLPHDIIDLTSITHLISNSALTSSGRFKTSLPNMQSINPQYDMERLREQGVIDVPDGHYAEETMKATVVPNRNMIMLSIAAGVAVNEDALTLGVGVHAGDHFIYPDCRPRFIRAVNATIGIGNMGFGMLPELGEGEAPIDFIFAPFLNKSKADIAYRALELGVPLHLTWSCYKGGEKHCGRCGTCVERLEAVDEAITRIARLDADAYLDFVGGSGHTPGEFWDNTEYEDTEFWRNAIKEARNAA